MTFEEKLRQAFNAGLKCNQEHPDDDSYDQVHFDRVLKLLDQPAPPSSPTATAEDDYIPFGNDWRNEMRKMTKDDLIEFTRKHLIELQESKVAVEHLEIELLKLKK